MLEFYRQNKIQINLSCNFPHKTKFGSTHVAIFHSKQTSNQPMLQLSWHNKIRINLRCNSPHKTKFRSTYVGLYHTKQIRINLCSNFPHKTKFEKRALVCEDLFQTRLVSTFGYTYVGLLSTKKKIKKIRIKLYCNCPDKTKFGPTYVAIFHRKQNSD